MKNQGIPKRHLRSILDDLVRVVDSRVLRCAPRFVLENALTMSTGGLGSLVERVSGVGIVHCPVPFATDRLIKAENWMADSKPARGLQCNIFVNTRKKCPQRLK
jgi:hypothetical protein